MASGPSGVVVLVLCACLVPDVFADWGSDCLSYTDLNNVYHSSRSCFSGFCCGSCFNRYCCYNSHSQLSDDQQEDCPVEPNFAYYSPAGMIVGISSLIIVLLSLICCCVCPCCCLYKMFRKPRTVIATTTSTAMVTGTPQNYPQQQVATPSHPQSYQGPQYQPYQPYQPVPVQPGYGNQPMPQAYGAQPTYQGQPFTPGPPPTYQEATGPTYPPNPMPYSQAAFSPGQPAYPLQPPAQPGPNAPPANTDFLTQPAFNPEYVAPRTG